jgi:ATP-binding cassette subfamily B protein
LKPFWLPTLLAPLLMILEVAMDLSQPRLLQTIVDVGIKGHNLSSVLHTSYWMLIVAVVGLIGGVGCGVFATIAALNFSTSIRDKLFNKVQQLSFGNLDRLETGGLITRLTSDVDQVQEAVLMLLRMMVRAPLLTIGGLIMAVVTAPKLSLILLVIGPIVIFVLVLINRKAHLLFTTVQESLDDVNTVTQENLAGVRVVKAFVRGVYESARFGRVNERLSADKIKALSAMATVMPGMMLLINIGIAAVLWFGGVSVTKGNLQVGQLLAFVNYLLQMLSSLMMASMALIMLSRADASAERIVEVLDSMPDIQEKPDAIEAPAFRGRVAFDHVSFTYNLDDGSSVLRDVSFVAEPGLTIGILGSTGVGKSTLVHLIPRLYDVTAGQVLIDDIDVRDMTESSLRKQIAIVMQNTILFSGTIRDNLRFGKPDATDTEIEEAARMAQAHDFIVGFPDGYDSVLGQSAVNLSGGQKQRIAIARALVAKPSILILDDCTSAVDMTTEAKILEELNAWSHKCTRFVIAQRISAVVGADKILVIENGGVAAEGTHSELMHSSPAYQGILRSQISGQEVNDVD